MLPLMRQKTMDITISNQTRTHARTAWVNAQAIDLRELLLMGYIRTSREDGLDDVIGDIANVEIPNGLTGCDQITVVKRVSITRGMVRRARRLAYASLHTEDC